MTPNDLSQALRGILPKATAWALAQEANVLSAGVPLSAEQIAVARAVCVLHPDRVRVLVLEEMPFPDDPELAAVAKAAGLLGADTAGLTLGYAVLVRSGYLTTELIAHELRHVHQYEAAGSVGSFLGAYLEQIAEVGYFDSPFERDARDHESCADGPVG